MSLTVCLRFFIGSPLLVLSDDCFDWFQPELLKKLSDVLKHGGNSPVARMQAGIQLKNALYSKDHLLQEQYRTRWLQFPQDVRLYVKKNVSFVQTTSCLHLSSNIGSIEYCINWYNTSIYILTIYSGCLICFLLL